jgi:aldose 1-epimerase
MSRAPVLPSGEQIELRRGGQRAVVVEVGAALREYERDGLPLLDGFEAGEMAAGARGQPLLPWPNRIRDGRYRFLGREHCLPIDERARGNAIHGLARWRAWRPLERQPDRVRMGLLLHPQPGYPFALALEVEYALVEAGLRVTLSGRNAGDRPLPFGAGHHPYLSPGPGLVDAALLRLPASSCLEADDRGIPTGRLLSVDGTGLDFRSGRAIGRKRLDTAFTGLERGPDGLARVELAPPQGPARVLWADAAFPYLMAFTGDTLSEDRRRRGLAVEPMSCPPNAFQTGESLVVLEPGQSWSGSWGIELGAG